jgi:N-acyl homoserine lactone hydrolase
VETTVHRIDFGHFIRPGSETQTGEARVEPCLGYLVVHPDGLVLVDTGMGSHPDVDAHYQPSRIGLPEALASVGVRIEDLSTVVNCHLHFDHCGGNPLVSALPIVVQSAELDLARQPGHTLPELVDDALHYEVIDGEAEILPQVTVLPTPGHTAGHQSLVVRTGDGTVIVAGQCHDTASDYASDVLAWHAHLDGSAGDVVLPPAWMDRLQQFDPKRVVFAHDHATWVP